MIDSAIVLDAAALSAAADESATIQEWVEAAIQSDRPFSLSAVTMAETTDGSGRDVAVRRVANNAAVHDVTPEIAYAAGAMRAQVRRRKQRDLTVDAIVAATAASLPGLVVVVTSDPSDLEALLDGTDVRVASIT